ncbi:MULTISPECIES: helix-turn-helix domain-containing protein [unclassified Natrinema]|uniref:helix-turn-helix domain-containing protein n=1 Tax=unclassified Natrinema TaxID=2622230 RepID=UPI00026D4C82|nr:MULTISPECIES: helix-turn-helix domain-containing protein [unclassified Natrinema]AFO57198.1 Bacterio-opsin activator HTH domain protein [Natrinema sp. J7-2]
MSSTNSTTTTTGATAGTRLTLEIWHPDCWGLQATEAVDAGLLVHTVHRTLDETVKGHFTVYADTTARLDEFVAFVDDSPLTYSTVELGQRTTGTAPTPGNVTRELFVDYDPEHSISDTLVSHGFIHDASVRVEAGAEHWPVFVAGDRVEVRDRLDTIRAETDAEISISRIAPADADSTERFDRTDRLTPRQRAAFDLACERNYYAWPRETSTRELAAELGVSKTTLLEHLRTAEAKLLNPDGELD